MTKPVYLTSIQIVTNKINSDGTTVPYRETLFSFGCKETKTSKEASKWHNYLIKFIEIYRDGIFQTEKQWVLRQV